MKLPTIACGFIVAPTLFAGEPGKLSQELWTDLPGSNLSDLTTSSRFYEAADSVSSIDGALSMTASKSGARLRGYITIPADGDYQFAVAGDDAGELNIALDGNKFHADAVASFSSWTGVQNFTKKASQLSSPVSLTAGQRIFVEMLLKGGGGTEGIAMGWIIPGSTEIVQVPASVLESYVIAEDANDADGNGLPDHLCSLTPHVAVGQLRFHPFPCSRSLPAPVFKYDGDNGVRIFGYLMDFMSLGSNPRCPVRSFL